ncbi:hypothetical protein CW703_07310 [Candidatus Bathyarchaeota archaeon]|nr:MAG: hypothetical protein CW703_07310 [Candidatus Bathyarchaeota archaeon]
MPKLPGVLVLALVLTYGWALAWMFAEVAIPDLPGWMIGGWPFSLLYILVFGGIILGGGIAAYCAWYFTKKDEEMLRMIEKKEAR